MTAKPIHVKPSLYALFFHDLKEIALEYGYNLVLHGSLNRDFDLIAIAWQQEVKDHSDMIKAFAELIDGRIMLQGYGGRFYECTPAYHGRLHYIINLWRGGTRKKPSEDQQYYLDISVIPPGDRVLPSKEVTREQYEESILSMHKEAE
jgi:hypothetical protein